jgi:hypothetical protein
MPLLPTSPTDKPRYVTDGDDEAHVTVCEWFNSKLREEYLNGEIFTA